MACLPFPPLSSESVRQNAALLMDGDLELRPLRTPQNVVSASFPRTLGELFNMSGTFPFDSYAHHRGSLTYLLRAEQTAVVLLQEHGRPDAIVSGPGSHEKNVNEFMRLCGVRYLLVRRRSSS